MFEYEKRLRIQTRWLNISCHLVIFGAIPVMLSPIFQMAWLVLAVLIAYSILISWFVGSAFLLLRTNNELFRRLCESNTPLPDD